MTARFYHTALPQAYHIYRYMTIKTSIANKLANTTYDKVCKEILDFGYKLHDIERLFHLKINTSPLNEKISNTFTIPSYT